MPSDLVQTLRRSYPHHSPIHNAPDKDLSSAHQNANQNPEEYLVYFCTFQFNFSKFNSYFYKFIDINLTQNN